MKRSKLTGYPIHPHVRKRVYIRNLSLPVRLAIQTSTMASMITIGTMCGAFLVSYFSSPRDPILAQIIEWSAFIFLCYLMNFCMSIYCAARNRFK